MLGTARKLRARKIPADVIVLDGQAWQDNRTRFRFAFDPARYPDPKALLDELHALNFKVCVWEYPMVSRARAVVRRFRGQGLAAEGSGDRPRRSCTTGARRPWTRSPRFSRVG